MRLHRIRIEKWTENSTSYRKNCHLDTTKSQTKAIAHVSIANWAINRPLQGRLLEANPIGAPR